MFQAALFTEFLKISEVMTIITLVMLFGCFVVVRILEVRKLSFSLRILVALFLGISVGFIIQYIAGFPSIEQIRAEVWIQQTMLWYGLFGTVFVGFIRMLIFPIIIVSMIRVILDLKQGVNMSELVKKSLFWLLTITGISSILGIILALSTQIGADMTIVHEASKAPRKIVTIVDVLLNLVPANPIQSMVDNNVIAMVIFASLVGSSARILRAKEQYRTLIDGFAQGIEAMSHIVMSMAMTVIKFMPYAVVALMAKTLISYGLNVISDALSFIFVIYAAIILMLIIHMGLILLHGLNPLIYIKKSLPAFLLAFSSRSSISTLPVTIATLENRLGVNTSTANFVSSLGSTVGMNGCAGFFPAIVVLMITKITGTPVDISLLVMIVIISILSSLGLAGIPGSATMAVSIMLAGLGMTEYFDLLAIVFAIDPILDMGRTMINVSGAMTAAICTDRELGLINTDIYYADDSETNTGDQTHTL